MKTILKTAALLLVALCAGCAGPRLQRLDISQAEKAEICKIAILQVAPMPPVMVLNSNVGMKMLGGGLVPGIIEQNAIQTKSEAYLAALKQRNLTFGPELAVALKAALSKDGYEVEYLETQPPVWKAGEPDISAVKTNADTVLQVLWGSGGYLSPDFDDHYTPLVNFAVALVNTRTQKTIYYRQFSGSAMVKQQQEMAVARDGSRGAFVPNTTVLVIGPAPGYRYPNFESLMANFAASAEGIRATQRLVADQVGMQLAK